MASRNYLIMSSDMTLTDKKEYRMSALSAGLERCGVKTIGDVNADIPANWDAKGAIGLQAIPLANKDARVAEIRKFISTGRWPRSIDQRELAPFTDFVLAAAQDFWITPALAAVGTVYTALNALAAYTFPAGRMMVCYGISINAAAVPLPISRLIFRRQGAAGNIQAQFDVQPLGPRLETVAFFSEPVVIDPQEAFAIQVLCSNIAPATEIHIDNFVFEGSGGVIA
jgi:hypothetical protein